jgi:uncharacterized protein involved in type VI secretion and phage assembly
MANGPPFIGKFRATVSDNQDPNGLGRVKVKAPDVYGDEESGWALPASPYTGNGVGLFLIPPTGASVWVEFEHGDSEFPIWAGGFWSSASEVPVTPGLQQTLKKVLKTETATFTLDDTDGVGGVTIETKDGMKIKMSAKVIEISNGLNAVVKLEGPKVSINGTAFEVT